MSALVKNLLQKHKAIGILKLSVLILKRLFNSTKKAFYYLYWLIYRFRNSRHLKSSLPNYLNESELATLNIKETSIRQAIQNFCKQSFLEIGIGAYPILDRLKLISQMNIEYLGCDFDSVCQVHQRMIGASGLNINNLNFIGNKQGSYTWRLFELMQKSKKFDLIFLDGHHTFYIDLPAFYIAHELLEPGGYIFIDDVKWNLSFLRENFLRSFNEWYFYHNMYDFSQYSINQQSQNHIELIVNEVLLKKYNYRIVTDFSTDEWCLLQKPNYTKT
jgi:hypothetical protein